MVSKLSKRSIGDGGIGAFLFLSFIGAAVFFISKANGFWEGVLGFFQALVWPAILVYELLDQLIR